MIMIMLTMILRRWYLSLVEGIAPKQDSNYFRNTAGKASDNDEDDDWSAPDGSHGQE